MEEVTWIHSYLKEITFASTISMSRQPKKMLCESELAGVDY
jgi:hypothetical protein